MRSEDALTAPPLTTPLQSADHAFWGPQVLPDAPEELVAELSRRYILLYEMITQEQFQPTPPGNAGQRIADNIRTALQQS